MFLFGTAPANDEDEPREPRSPDQVQRRGDEHGQLWFCVALLEWPLNPVAASARRAPIVDGDIRHSLGDAETERGKACRPSNLIMSNLADGTGLVTLAATRLTLSIPP